MKRKLSLALAVVSLALLAEAGIALADGNVSFGIRPTRAYEDRPQTFSYFSYELVPGSVMSDEALVMNSGDVPVTLKLFAADGITAVNGGTAFARQGQETNGVSQWLSLAASAFSLEPGEEMVVPFTINVPSNASPGHHVAGLVVAAPSSGETSRTGEGEAQFTARVVRQAGVAVVIDVPGPHVAGLEITGAELKQQDDQGATFVIAVRNTGNIFLKAEGSLLITDREGKELASVPLNMGTVLPGDTTTFQVTYPVHLADGQYLVTAALEYADGQVAPLEGAEVQVIDGQPEVKGEFKGPVLPPAITDIVGTREESGVLFYTVLVVLAMGTLGAAYWIGRRLTRRQLEPAVAHGGPAMALASPQLAVAAADAGGAVAPSMRADTTRKVLLVDDEEGVLALLSAILQSDQRNQVLLARDGQEALEVARREKPDLIFLDILMPLMDGYEVARALKSDPATAHIKVVMVTALAHEQDRRRALEVGAAGYFTKPFNPTEILAKADEVLAP